MIDVFRGWRRDRYAALAVWVFAMLVFTWDRPFFSLDETRYLTVAWEMMLRGEFISPSLNTIFYEHKPPLLFWLLNLGWVTGAYTLWAKLLPILIAVGTALSLATVARRVYGHEAAPLAALIYLGTLGITLQAPLVMFDGLLTLCLALSMIPLTGGCREGRWSSFAISGVAVGLGLLAKGPVIYVYYLPLLAVVLFTWRGEAPMLRWMLGGLFAVLISLAIFMMWIGPLLTDPAVRELFTAQVTDRLTATEADLGHNRPFWIYLVWAPILLIPWVFVKPLWPWGSNAGAPDRWLLGAALVAVLILSLISNKQPHYLSPVVAILAPMWAGAWVAASRKRRAWVLAVIATIPILLGALLMMVRGLTMGTDDGAWLADVNPAWAVLMLMVGGIVPRLWDGWRGVVLVLPSSAMMLVLGLGYVPMTGDRMSTEPMGEVVAAAVDDGRPVAFLGRYQGQFNFVARLPLVHIQELNADNVDDWLAEHPDGMLLTRSKRTQIDTHVQPEAVQLYRTGVLYAFRASTLAASGATFRDCPRSHDGCRPSEAPDD